MYITVSNRQQTDIHFRSIVKQATLRMLFMLEFIPGTNAY